MQEKPGFMVPKFPQKSPHRGRGTPHPTPSPRLGVQYSIYLTTLKLFPPTSCTAIAYDTFSARIYVNLKYFTMHQTPGL